ncbi:hypothetical protein D3C74_315440 [compost metagenome]
MRGAQCLVLGVAADDQVACSQDQEPDRGNGHSHEGIGLGGQGPQDEAEECQHNIWHEAAARDLELRCVVQVRATSTEDQVAEQDDGPDEHEAQGRDGGDQCKCSHDRIAAVEQCDAGQQEHAGEHQGVARNLAA